MSTNPLRQLEQFGQSIWLDYIRRDLIAGGGLKRLIDEDGLRGMTSNPAIFEKAIVDSKDYDSEIQAMAAKGMEPLAIYDELSQTDVRRAADVFRTVYDGTAGLDGYVSLEVNPHLARDTQGTEKEARRLWAGLARPNVLIKVPATSQGLHAIRTLTSEGISVNVTLIFGLGRYREVAEAYIAGLESLAAQGKPLKPVASVASFFISRIDTMVDGLLDLELTKGAGEAELAKRLRGRIAIASAKKAYLIYKELFGSGRFKKLADKGARPQRLLWASTSSKNPADSDVKYVEALIGADTVNTAPLETINAYRDHGRPEARLESGAPEAGETLDSLRTLGINLDQVTQKLEDEGVEKFNQPFDKLIASLAKHEAAKA
jgi:transaldolase